MAGSNDEFQADDTGYVPVTQLSRLNGKRYLRFKVEMQTTDRGITPSVLSLSLSYRDGGRDFSFGVASCAGVGHSSRPTALFYWAFLGLIPFVFRWFPLRCQKGNR